MNNKKLLYILLGLGILYALTQLFNTKKERSFDSQFLKIDTSLINKLVLHSVSDGHKEIVLEKSNAEWWASQGGKKIKAEAGSVDGMIKELALINVKTILTESKDKHKDYEIEDEKGSRVEVYNGSKKLADFYVGKFGFNPQGNSMVSYLRKAGENKVYGVDGFQSMTFNQQFSNFRDKTITKMNTAEISSVTINSNGAIQSLLKQGNSWSLNQNPVADSTAVQNYLNSLQSITGSELIDQFQPSTPLHTAKLEANNSTVDINIYASGDSLKPFMIKSSANKEVYFKEDSNGVYHTLIKGLSDLSKLKK